MNQTLKEDRMSFSSFNDQNNKNPFPTLTNENNFLSYYIQKHKKYKNKSPSMNIIAKLKFWSNFLYQNGTKNLQDVQQKANALITHLNENKVISIETDFVNDQVLVLIKEDKNHSLLIGNFNEISSNRTTKISIVSEEACFLDAKFYPCLTARNLIILLGLNSIYLIKISDYTSRSSQIVNLSDKSFVRHFSSANASHSFYPLEAENSKHSIHLIEKYPNDNYTNLIVSAAGSYIIFYSILSKRINVFIPSTGEKSDFYTSHFFTNIEVSTFTSGRILCYQNTADNCKITVFDVKTRRSNQIQAGHSILKMYTSRNRYESTHYQPTSCNKTQCKFFKEENSILVSIFGMMFFFKNRHADRELLEFQNYPLCYELINIVNIFSTFNTTVF